MMDFQARYGKWGGGFCEMCMQTVIKLFWPVY